MIAIAALPSPRRSLRMVQRNLLVYKHTWMVIFSGFFEPLFYLLGIGIGSRSDGPADRRHQLQRVRRAGPAGLELPERRHYRRFLQHATSSCTYQKTYDGILATPMRVPDVAFGEMLWALGRGSLYAAAFLVVLLALGAVIRAADAAVALGAAGVAGGGARRRQRFPRWRSA